MLGTSLVKFSLGILLKGQTVITMRRRFRLKVSAVAMMLAAGGAAHAATYTFDTLALAVDATGEPLSAAATFETYSNRSVIDITLTNWSSPLRSVGQAVTGISFGLSGIIPAQITSVSVKSGQESSIDGTGTPSATPAPAAWYLQPGTGGADTLSVFGHGHPQNSLLPALSSYSDANSSIDGNSSHNPFYTGSVTFELQVANVTNTSGVSCTGVTVEFGTTPQHVTAQLVSSVPEPETYAMMLAGLGLMGFMARRKKQA